MDFLTDWKFWLFFVTIVSGIINWLSNYKIMNNDLRHLSISLKAIEDKVEKNSKDIAYIKGKLDSKTEDNK